ncbi:PAS domain S-box protein, partial [Sphingomonas sp.]|uniref:PAS domain S-box protein n=1 Tax=Sphingomonas sp. TaxID=28214 RepID=UPI0035B0B497
MTGRKAAMADGHQLIAPASASLPTAGGPLPGLDTDADPILRDQFLRAVLLNMSEAVVAIDSRGIILFFSPGSEQLLGYSAGETVGRNVSMLMAGADSAQHDAHLLAYLQSGQSGIIGRSRQVTAVTKAGERIAVDLRVVAFALAGVQLFIGTMRDVRERVEREL